MKKIIFILFVFAVLAGCRKRTRIYSIKGKILLSSSNPVPVSNYKLSFYQAGSPGAILPIGASSSSGASVTDAEGNFNCRFPAGEAFFFMLPLSSNVPLSMAGANPDPAINLYWSNIPAKDTALQDVYLYKMIKKAVIKLNTNAEILSSDTLHIIAPTSTGQHDKFVTGLSIPANTTVAIDTISNLIFSNFDVKTKKYSFNIFCSNSNSRRSYSTIQSVDPLDEQEKDIILF